MSLSLSGFRVALFYLTSGLVLGSTAYAESELFEVINPFPDDASTERLKACYPSIAYEDLQRLQQLRYVGYLERLAQEDEQSEYCRALGIGTAISERTIDIELGGLSLPKLNSQIPGHERDVCEEKRSYGGFRISSLTSTHIIATTSAYYRRRDCGSLLGVKYKNDLYLWRGELDFHFTLEEVLSRPNCTDFSGDGCDVVAQAFAEPYVTKRTIEEKKYHLSAILTPEGLALTLGLGLIGGPGGAFAGAVTSIIGYEFTYQHERDAQEERMVRTASTAGERLINKLVADDLLNKLSTAVKSLTREIETIGSGYRFAHERSGFIEVEPGVAGYRTSSRGGYCSDQRESMMSLRRNTILLLGDFSDKGNELYLIKEGDKLWDLAERKFGDGRAFLFIAQYNGISNPSLIRSGEHIEVPGRSALCTTNNDNALVLRGYTLAELAGKKNVRWPDYASVKTFSGNSDLVYPFETIRFVEEELPPSLKAR